MERPISVYVAFAIESFPRVSRTRSIDASMAGRSKLDILLVNLSINNEKTDDYIEFRTPGTMAQFLDLSSLALEESISVRKSDGIPLADTGHVTLSLPHLFIFQ